MREYRSGTSTPSECGARRVRNARAGRPVVSLAYARSATGYERLRPSAYLNETEQRRCTLGPSTGSAHHAQKV